MFLDKVISVFKPKNDKFYALFDKNTQNIVDAADAMSLLLQTQTEEDRNAMVDRIKSIESAGDNITHEIFKELSRNFITPFDREDIHLLASSLDDILDYLNGVAQRIKITNMMEFTPAMKNLSSLIKESCFNVQKAVTDLKELNYSKINHILVKIHSIENQADQAYDLSISDLFQNEKDALKVIKNQQILDLLETTTDKCEDIANVIESITLKYS